MRASKRPARTAWVGRLLVASALAISACSSGEDDDASDDTASDDTGSDTTTADTDPPDDTASDDTASDDTASDDTTSDTTGQTDATTGDTSASGDLETGPGVSDSTIRIGVLTDLSGPFAAGAAVQVTMFRAYWDAVNEAGGVCDRDIEMDVQDHGYDPQEAVSLYRAMVPDVLALQQILGSPMVAALMDPTAEDNVYVGGMGWASVVLPYEHAQMPGPSYSIEGANAIDYLVAELGVQAGDSVGHIYFAGDYGGDSLSGSTFAAEQHGITIVEQEVTPVDTDLTSQVAALNQEGVSAVILSAAPGQLASLASSMQAVGLEVPIVGNTPTFNPALLDGEAADWLIANFHGITAVAPYATAEPGPQAAVEMYEAAAPDGDKGWEVPLAYLQAELLKVALEGACENGTLTREGVVQAMRETADLDTAGLLAGPADYTTVGEPPLRTNYISAVDPEAPGGLTVVTTFEGDSAAAYSFE